jgi:hypothetical protein
VPADRVGETTLLLGGKSAQSQGDREGHVTCVETILQLGSQPSRQQQASFHPGLLAP